MNRERIAWIVSLLLLTLAAFRLDRTLAARDDDYTWIRTFIDIHRQVVTNYVEPVDDAKLQQAAIEGMLGQLDPFTTYVPPARTDDFNRMLEGTFKGVGIQLNQRDDGRVEVITPIEGSPASKAGVMAGDIILKVNGQPIQGLPLKDVIKKIGGELGSEVRLTVQHETGEQKDLKMRRQEIVVPTIKGYQRRLDNSWDYYVSSEPRIAYIQLTQFTPSSAEALRSVINGLLADGMKGLILDLRFNPGGQFEQAVQVVDMFLETGTIVLTRYRSRPQKVDVAHPAGTLPHFPLIVLVNGHSASASEIVAGSLQDNRRAVVIGTRTYGKGSVQEVIPLDGNSGELKLTVAYYYLPSGRLVHRKKDAADWGVEPLIVVPMDEEAENRLRRDRYERDLFRRPTTRPTTRGATTRGAAMADVQLQRAIDTMLGSIILGGQAPLPVALPTTAPASGPATRAAQR